MRGHRLLIATFVAGMLTAFALTLAVLLAATGTSRAGEYGGYGGIGFEREPATASIASYAGPGAWIDIYDERLLAHPVAVAAWLEREGIGTLYLETANWKQPRGVYIVYPRAVAALIDAAHARGIDVVAWFLPGLDNLPRDYYRSLAAILFRTAQGGRFDGFALDIESSNVGSIPERNRALRRLSDALRARVGPGFALGAIVPDDRSTAPTRSLWPQFPYEEVAARFDVFLPMAYSTVRASGLRGVARYTYNNVRHIRELSGDESVRVHVIGGLADGLDVREAAGFAYGARAAGALGASFYDLTLSRARHHWALRTYGPAG